MAKDPFSGIVNMLKEQSKTFDTVLQLAEVISAPPEIKIKVKDVEIDKDNIMIADYLLPEYKREFTQSCEGEIISHTEPPALYDSHTIVESLNVHGKCSWTDTLAKGDVVAVFPIEDWQNYVIVARVVRL